jgi:hypothetical protein
MLPLFSLFSLGKQLLDPVFILWLTDATYSNTDPIEKKCVFIVLPSLMVGFKGFHPWSFVFFLLLFLLLLLIILLAQLHQARQTHTQTCLPDLTKIILEGPSFLFVDDTTV